MYTIKLNLALAALSLFLSCFFVSGCEREEIASYRVPKEVQAPAPPAAPAMGSMADNMGNMGNMGDAPISTEPEGERSEITWKVPAGWTELPATSMRIGSFSVQGKDGRKGDISVIPLSGVAGGELANINRWRGQLMLAPISEQDLATTVKLLKLGGHSVKVVDFASDENLIEGKFKSRITAAILERGEKTWFVKMSGENETLLGARKSFEEFLGSIKFLQ